MRRALVCWLRVVGRAMEGFSLAKRVRRRSDVSFWAVEFATFHPSTRFRVSRVLLFLVFLGIRNDSDVRRQLRSQRFSFFFWVVQSKSLLSGANTPHTRSSALLANRYHPWAPQPPKKVLCTYRRATCSSLQPLQLSSPSQPTRPTHPPPSLTRGGPC
ncbi:hypothetical protein BKA83DRAFT_2891493 [Pisolithus microcarpus]|nr:hypothetical protein BKA83DRAFT_2891493 [Pisolithus microcarpus]